VEARKHGEQRIAASRPIVQRAAAAVRYVPGMFKRRRATKPDFFRDSVKDRRATEDEQPWFLGEDDGPTLEVEAGRSAAMEAEDESREP